MPAREMKYKIFLVYDSDINDLLLNLFNHRGIIVFTLKLIRPSWSQITILLNDIETIGEKLSVRLHKILFINKL